MTSPAFMPAPRPAARMTAEDAKRLIEGAADLGFGRATSKSEPVTTAPVTQSESRIDLAASLPIKTLASERPSAPSRQTARKAPVSRAKPVADNTDSRTLRFDVPDEVWTALKLASVHRRVTVRFLLLEALHSAGYEIDLDSIAEDGRRLR